MPRYAFFGVTTTVDVVVVVTEVTLSQATRHHPQRNLLYLLFMACLVFTFYEVS
jgi:hypothetical protein